MVAPGGGAAAGASGGSAPGRVPGSSAGAAAAVSLVPPPQETCPWELGCGARSDKPHSSPGTARCAVSDCPERVVQGSMGMQPAGDSVSKDNVTEWFGFEAALQGS